jgi:hypothetical protein
MLTSRSSPKAGDRIINDFQGKTHMRYSMKMKSLLRLYIVLPGLLFIQACAGGMIQIPQKYALDGQLEQVKMINRQRIMQWDVVDNQSLIIETGPGNYYLLVLSIPSPELVFRHAIRISTTGSMIRAGLDDVIVYVSSHMKSSYPIDRIYRIRGTAQMRAIKDQLTVKKGIDQKKPDAGSSNKSKSPNHNGADI